MKIILTVTNDLAYDQRMMRICGSLAAAGHEVELVGRLRPGSPLLPEMPYRQTRLPCYFEKGKLFYTEYDLRLLIWLFFRRFDALCAVDLDTILPCLWAGWWHRKPCVYDAHEYFTEVPEVVRRPRVRRIWERVARYAIPRMKRCYTVGDCLAEVLSECYGVPFTSIRNVPLPFVPLNSSSAESPNAELEFSRAKDSAPKIILYQGALNEGRGLETAIEAMQEIEGTVLWLAGEGDLSTELREKVKQLSLTQKVHFLGFVLPKALPEITAQAWIGLNLLENKGLSYYYSLANKAFDYIQAGLPSIQMDFPEYRKLNEDWQVFELVADLEVETLRQAIRKLLHDAPHYQKLQENCQKAAAILNWEQEEFKLLAIYEEIFSSHNNNANL
ncbi:MAG: glycosyltransferase [Saprospiraceae bacterium]|nr:glycosyltransferase [Saprospiraceae bacterium]